jgi:hypothetical protein
MEYIAKITIDKPTMKLPALLSLDTLSNTLKIKSKALTH